MPGATWFATSIKVLETNLLEVFSTMQISSMNRESDCQKHDLHEPHKLKPVFLSDLKPVFGPSGPSFKFRIQRKTIFNKQCESRVKNQILPAFSFDSAGAETATLPDLLIVLLVFSILTGIQVQYSDEGVN